MCQRPAREGVRGEVRRPSARARLLLVAITLLLAGVLVPAARAAAPLTLGFFDPKLTGAPGDDRWLAKAQSDGARVFRIQVPWYVVETAPPAHAGDPADPAYRWAGVDAQVRAARAHGFRVVATLGGAPAWDEGPGRPAGAPAGTWRPDAAAFGAFATAAAKRYGRSVYAWQVWNEPNLPIYLAPQWVRSGSGFVPASPVIYRAMLNAVYRGVKAVNPRALVLTAGTAPYGDPLPGNGRIQPVAWWRSLLCLRGTRLRPAKCPDPAHFDVYSHHPYAIAGPRAHAGYPDDAAIPDVRRISRVIRAAVAHRTALPHKRKRAWVTEISWDSDPPDPDGVPAARHARWLEGALYQFWLQGVDTVLWFQIVDESPVPSYPATIQSGIYLRSGRAKLAARAFRFPFVAAPPAHGRVALWGEAPRAGTVRIERRAGGRWRVLARLHAGANRVFSGHVTARRNDVLRARSAGAVSLTWRVGRDG